MFLCQIDTNNSTLLLLLLPILHLSEEPILRDDEDNANVLALSKTKKYSIQMYFYLLCTRRETEAELLSWTYNMSLSLVSLHNVCHGFSRCTSRFEEKDEIVLEFLQFQLNNI